MFCPRCAAEVSESSKLCSSCGLDMTAITEITREKATEAPDDFAMVQDALSGEYEVIEELGRGGMAVVYRAKDKNLEREVAVKVLPLSMAYDAEFVTRFQREAKTAAQLEHPNVIPIYRVGQTGRVIFFVMKFLRGKSLGDLVDEHGPMPPSEIRRIVAEAADALGYAHENGVVHRDIKPDNIVFDEKGRSIVTDFGIAKAATGTRLTGTGMAIGTPYYMSPEQARAQDLDGRSDIYSLGVVAYQCLTGHVPFEGEDSFAVGIKHISEDLPIPELKTEPQRELFVIIQKMLAKSPDERFQNTAELIAALRGGATTAATQAMAASDPSFPPIASTTPTTPLPQMAAAATVAAPATKKKMSVPVMAAIAGVILIGGGGAIVMATRGGDTPVPGVTEDSTGAVASANPEGAAGDSAAPGDGSGTAEASGSDSAAVSSAAAATSDQAAAAAATPPERPEPEPRISPAQQRWNAEVERIVGTIARQAAEQGYEGVGTPITGSLADDGTRDHTINMRAGQEYALVGFCDADCNDLDLAISDPSNRVIDSDYELDARPVVALTTGVAGQYTVRVTMPGCSASSCRYGFRVFARSGRQTTPQRPRKQ